MYLHVLDIHDAHHPEQNYIIGLSQFRSVLRNAFVQFLCDTGSKLNIIYYL